MLKSRLILLAGWLLVTAVAACIWILMNDSRVDTKRDVSERTSRSRVELICAEIRHTVDVTGDYPSASIGAQTLLRPYGHPSDSNPLLDGWGREPRLIAEDHRVVGAYSLGEDGRDEGGHGGDDIACLG